MQPMSTSIASGHDLPHLVTCGFAARAIRYKARQLAGRHGFSRSEREDIEQELRLDLLRRLAKFNPDIAPWNAFVRTLVDRHAATLIAQRRRRIRATDDTESLIESRHVSLDTVLDTKTVLAQLPRRARALCERLKQHTVAEVARQLRVPRSTLRGDIARVREQFQRAGFTISQKSVRHFAASAGR
jgi:RNA polymerase sigma-70 factor, ECF subfamily